MSLLSGFSSAAGNVFGTLKETASSAFKSATDAVPEFFSSTVGKFAEAGTQYVSGLATSALPNWTDNLFSSRTQSPVIDPTIGNAAVQGLQSGTVVQPAASITSTADFGATELLLLAGVAAVLVFAIVKFR